MESFIGAWRLVAFEEVRPDGEVVYPYGKDAVGLLIYDSSGRMSVQIMKRDRAPFLSTDWQSVPAEEIKKTIEGFTAFFGTYEVEEENRIVIHRVEGHVLKCDRIFRTRPKMRGASETQSLRTFPRPALRAVSLATASTARMYSTS